MTQIQHHSRSILVIEDDIDISDFLGLLPGMSGYIVYTANTGEQGLTLAATVPIEVVLLDRRLPDMDGFGVYERLHDKLEEALPVMMMTADYDPELEAAARAAGMTAFITKPFAPSALLDK